MSPSDSLTEHFRLTESYGNALRKLGILTIRDLLFHFPFRYESGGDENTVGNLKPGEQATIYGHIEKLQTRKSWKRRVPIAEGYIRDTTGRIKVMWFHQPYIAKMYREGTYVKAVGKVGGTEGKTYLANPELSPASPTETGLFPKKEPGEKIMIYHNNVGTEIPGNKLFAVYPETRGVTSLWFRHALEKVMGSGALDTLEDPVPAEMLEKYHLPKLKTALLWAHAPKNLTNAEAARKRFAFEEVFYIQLEKQQARKREEGERGFRVDAKPGDVAGFIEAFPFKATAAQRRAVEAILSDFKRGFPMSRLMEGDVGSGKTAVAAATAYAVVQTRPSGQTFGNLQVAYMAPTEILAKQHFESFIKYFECYPVNIGLLTGSGCQKFPSKIRRDKATDISRPQLLKWVASGEIPILIGTHALIEKAVRFKHLAYVIIDEQHRFGTNQRKKLARKDVALPHLLSMTATPIPRTLALTIYGNLDLTLLDEMPPGRKQIITDVLKSAERDKAYERIRAEIATGRQAYVICPRIDEPDPKKFLALNAKSVKEEAKRLKKEVFPDLELEILHGKMKPKEKDDAMRRFSEGAAHILVATSVVEVGVNVPNATVILIEGAERFGLSQLHQLRGRVVRSNFQAYCFALAESRGKQTLERLKVFKTAKNGFELAELDLMQRGPGELGGRKQWGISDIGMEALKNLKLVEAARTEARAIIEKDTELQGYPLLKELVAARCAQLHFE